MASFFRRRSNAWCLVAYCAVVSACGSEDPRYDRARAALVSGQPSADESIVGLALDGKMVCSGTLIAPAVVLTGGHCLDHPEELTPLSGLNSEIMLPKPSGFLRHPEYRGAGDGRDIGVLVLSAASPTPIATLPDAPLSTNLAGETCIVAGYGREIASEPATGKRREGFALIETWESEMLRLVPQPAAACNGDSGGPSFTERSGNRVMLGVTSSGDALCQSYARQVRVDVQLQSFIVPALEAAARGELAFPRPSDDDAGCSLAGKRGSELPVALVVLGLFLLGSRQRGRNSGT